MQWMSLIAGTATTKLSKSLLSSAQKAFHSITGQSPEKQSFQNLIASIDKAEGRDLETGVHLSELKLNPDELNLILKLREIAAANGKGTFNVNIHGAARQIETESLELVS